MSGLKQVFAMTNSSKIKQDAQSLNKMIVFEDKQIRRTFHNSEWYFSIVDIVEVLSGTSNPRRYWSDLKIQLSENEGFIQLYGKIVQLKLLAPDGKMRESDTANTERTPQGWNRSRSVSRL